MQRNLLSEEEESPLHSCHQGPVIEINKNSTDSLVTVDLPLGCVHEKQRVERYKANLILWATKQSSESAKKDIGQEVTAADVHHNSTTSLTKEEAHKPSTKESMADPFENTTSEVDIIMPKKTKMAKEWIVVVTDEFEFLLLGTPCSFLGLQRAFFYFRT